MLKDVAAVTVSQLRYVIQTGDAFIDVEVEAETPAHPGESRHYIHNYFPDMSKDGMIVGVSCAVQDITELWQAEEELRGSETMFRQAARTARLGHWQYDELAERYLSISDEYARIFGYSAGEFVQRFNTYDEDIELVHPDDRARVTEAYKSRERSDLVYRIVRADGCERYVHEITRQTRDEGGRLVESMGTLQDITDIKRAGS